jgi:hypothetical protein
VPFPRPREQEMIADPDFQQLVLRAYSGLQISPEPAEEEVAAHER